MSNEFEKHNFEKLSKEHQIFSASLRERFSVDDQRDINKALLLAKEVHKNQKQVDGEPYLDHVLEVSNSILDKFGIKDRDVVLVALLHDAIEDQYKELFYNHIEKIFVGVDVRVKIEPRKVLVNYLKEICEIASWEIKDIFSEQISKSVSILSKPNFDSLIDHIMENSDDKDLKKSDVKNEVYRIYFKKIINSGDKIAPSVKLADFLNNISKNELLKDESKKDHFKKKYGAVLVEVVIPYLENMESENPLYEKKEELLKNFTPYVEKFTL